MNIQEYVAQPLIDRAVADERSRIVAELTDRANLNADMDLIPLRDAVAIVRNEKP